MHESTCDRWIVTDGTSELRAMLAPAARALREGMIVVFPTETVYGLGANALDARAVEAVFRAKRRPAANPLIVHVHSVAAARALTACWSDLADALAERFWPGPLTMVLSKSQCVPDIVTAGGSTVGIRLPDDPVAQTLIEVAATPVAAPSANRSGEVSPTRARHVHPDIVAAAAYVIDGGPCRGGIESTVVDVTVDPPAILRPGLVSRAMLLDVAGVLAPSAPCPEGPVRSPGAMGRHYAPRAELTVAGADALSQGSRLADRGIRTIVLGFAQTEQTQDNLSVIEMPSDSGMYAGLLYDALLAADRSGAQAIVVELPPDGDDWEAIRDRLTRASLR